MVSEEQLHGDSPQDLQAEDRVRRDRWESAGMFREPQGPGFS